jgi:subtilase family serine protease
MRGRPMVGKGVVVKRFLLVLVTLGIMLVATHAAASAQVVKPTMGVKKACKAGPTRTFQCFAMVVTRGGEVLRASDPRALPEGYGPAEYHTAYNLPTTAPNGSVTVAIVDAYDDKTILKDLNKYSAHFGLPVMPKCTATVTQSCFKKVNLGAPANSAVATGWDIEIALDVETVHAICQNCRIVLVEGVDNQFSSLEAAEAKAAKFGNIVSNSYGAYGYDGKSAPDDPKYNFPNKAIVVSAGDSGYGAAYPAVLNTVVSVGGTKLTLNADNTYNSERAWGPDGIHAWGTGSGCADGTNSGAASVPANTFQTSVANYSATGCGSTRGMNDVSANADPNTGSAVFTTSSGWMQVGGTSLAAPLIAAVFALKDTVSANIKPAATLYANAGTSAFRDVTAGTDDAGKYGVPCTHTSACNAVAGYDLPTGVGSPNGITGF